MMLTIEVMSVLTSLAFLVLLIRQNIWCWLFGIISSVLSVFLFYKLKLYNEAWLYGFYALFGFYGWYLWNRPKDNEQSSILRVKPTHIILPIAIGLPLGYLLGYVTKIFTDAAMPMLDAFTSIFGLIATYLEANRYIVAWVFWIILNGISVVMYFVRGAQIYSVLMVVYFFMSIYGFVQWKKQATD